MSWRSDAAGDAGDLDGSGARAIHLCAEVRHADKGGSAVGSGGEVGEARCAIGESAKHGVAVADAFAAGQAEAADDVASGTDEAFVDGGGQWGSGKIYSSLNNSGEFRAPVVVHRN